MKLLDQDIFAKCKIICKNNQGLLSGLSTADEDYDED